MKIAIVGCNQLGRNSTLSASFHINRLEGKKPFVKKNDRLVEIPESNWQLKDALYLLPNVASKVNELFIRKAKLETKISKTLCQ